MKLSKKNQSRQRAIRKALASGKSVGGLLAGALALATAGCSPEGHTRGPIGRFPDPSYEERAKTNACNETPPVQPTTGEVPPPRPPPKPAPMPAPKTDQPQPMRTMGIMAPRPVAKPPQNPDK